MVNYRTALKRFLYIKKLNGLSIKSLYDYEGFISMFCNYMGFDNDVLNLKTDDIHHYIESLYNRNISKNTIATYIRNVKIFCKFLENEYCIDVCAHNIVVPKTYQKIVHIYSDEEIRRIFEVVKNSCYIKWISSRDCSIVALMLDSGLRQNEVCTLKRSNIYFDKNVIKVLGKGDKERLVPIGSISRKFLDEYMKVCPHSSEFVFVDKSGDVLSCNAVKLLMQKYKKMLPFDFSSHKLRHNFATNYLIDQYSEHGHMDIYSLMVILGHEDVETTRRYLHVANQIIISQSNFSHLDRIFV